MSKRIITISRQFGSGGHSIGKMVAGRLGIPCYDNELVTRMAEESGFDASFIRENGEKVSTYTGADLFYGMGISAGPTFSTLSLYDRLYITQHNIIRDIAEKEECVIVGRCSDYILSERDDCVHVFIYADNDYRAERILRLYGDNGVKIEKRMKDKDSQRISYYEHYTNRDWGNPLNYHLCLNSGFIGDELCAEMIIKADQK